MVAGAPANASEGPNAAGAEVSGTSESRKAPETPNAMTVASSASVLRDSAPLASTKRAGSKQMGSSRIPAIAV